MPVVLGFVALVVAGLALLGLGAARRSRGLKTAGAGLLLALLGVWLFGPPGIALALLAVTVVHWWRSG